MCRPNNIWRVVLTLLCASIVQLLAAQRVVTPVESNDLPFELQKKEAAKALADTAAVDTAQTKEPLHKAPLFGGLMLTADLASPVMNLFGTQYGNYEVALEADIYHRFFPVVEVGLGTARYAPGENNYTYVCNPALYARLGANYNFFYNNGSESFIAVGLRYGLTGFSYQWQDITIDDPYWGSVDNISTPQQRAFAHWGEIVVALRVQVYHNFYMGWSGRYRLLIGCDTSTYGDPYFIPGFGPKDAGFAFTYTIGYRLPLGNSKKEIKLP